MITTLAEFEEGSAFERSALAAVYPLLHMNISRPLVDLQILRPRIFMCLCAKTLGRQLAPN